MDKSLGRIVFFTSLVLLAAFSYYRPAFASTIFYVSPQGDDNHDGRSPSSPFGTLAHAVNVVNPGDTVELMAGTYTGGMAIHRPGASNAWITLKPYRKEKAIIDAVGKENGLYFYNDSFAPMYWIVEGLEIRGGTGYVVKIDTPEVKLLNNNLHGSKNDIIKMVKTAHEIVIYGNEIHHPNAVSGDNAQGVDIVGATNVLVSHNYVHDIPSIGMYAKGNATNVRFEYNLVENIEARGIMLGQSTGRQFLDPNKFYESYDSTIRHNIIRNTGSACLATASSFNVKIDNNVCYDAATHAHAAIFISNESELGQAGTNIEIKHNTIILSGPNPRPMILVARNALTDDHTLHIDHNTYWASQGKNAVKFAWERGVMEKNASFPSFWDVDIKKWQNITGQDVSSIIANPTQQNAAKSMRNMKSAKTVLE